MGGGSTDIGLVMHLSSQPIPGHAHRTAFGVIRDDNGDPACVLPPDTSVIVPMVAIHRQVT